MRWSTTIRHVAVTLLFLSRGTAFADTGLRGLDFKQLLTSGELQPDGSATFGDLSLHSVSFGDNHVLVWNVFAPGAAYSIDPQSGAITTLLSKQDLSASGIWSLSVAGGNAAFTGGTGGVHFRAANGPIVPVFSNTSNLAVATDGSRVVYGNSAHDTIYAGPPSGPFQTVIDPSFTFPQTGDHPTFAEFSEFRGGNLLVFTGAPSSGVPIMDEGIFRWNGSSLTPLVQLGDVAPGGGSYQRLLLPVHFDGTNYSFGASLSDGRHVVIEHRNGSDSVALNLDQPIAGSPVLVSGGGYAGDGGYIAFSTRQPGQFGRDEGLYTDLTGSLTRVLGVGDVLDGRTVNSFGEIAVDAQTKSLAFEAGFTDGSSAIYAVTVPEPAVGLAGGLVLTLSLMSRRRRRNGVRTSSHCPKN